MQDLLKEITPRGDKTRQRIITYARRIFYERGFRRITVEELCSGLAISKRTFYKHFKGMEELVEAVVTDLFLDAVPKFIANFNSDKPIVEKLDEHFEILITEILSKVSITFMTDLETLLPELWQAIDDRRKVLVQYLIHILGEAQKNGEIREDIEVDKLGKLMQRVLVSVATPVVIQEMGLNMAEIAKNLRILFLYGILPRD